MRLAAALILAACLAPAQEVQRFRPWLTASQIALAAAHAADAASSYAPHDLSIREANPLYGRRFDGRDVALKVGIVAGVIISQRIVARRSRRARKIITVANFCVSGLIAGVAVRNWRIRQ